MNRGLKLEFEWDEDKNKINFEKHGVTFQIASRVFEDNNRIEFYDEAHSDYEDRYQTIGKVRDILFVVFTERKNNIRLISARKASLSERKLYHDHKIYVRSQYPPYPGRNRGN